MVPGLGRLHRALSVRALRGNTEVRRAIPNNATDAMTLRPYQSRVVADALASAEPTCIVAPTGAGKTVIGTALLDALPESRALWLVHTRALLAQTRDRLDGRACTVSTIQALLRAATWPDADLVILDEAHHYAAAEWRAAWEHYRDARIIGMTATPERRDGSPLGDIFSRLLVAAHYSELLDAGYLVPCQVLRPDERLDAGLAQSPANAYAAHGEGRSGYSYHYRIDEAEHAAAEYLAAGVPALAISERTDPVARADALDALGRGDLRLLTNVYALTEGVDVPSASVCVLARGVSHVSPYLQICGRILRPASGKSDALLIDLAGVSHEHGLPTDDRVYSLTGRAIRLAAEPVTQCPQCGATYDPGPTACPECGFVKPYEKWVPQRIWNVALRAHYRGAATADDAKRHEWRRLSALCASRGWDIAWGLKQYRQLFGAVPTLTDDEKKAVFHAFRARAAERGWKPNAAIARYKSTFGTWPEWSWR